MNVLVACEFSGAVREAFRQRGHNAWSCDIIAAEPGHHIQMDVRDVVHRKWDLMIAHPPCTYLSAAGLHYCRNNPERQRMRDSALEFVKFLWAAPVSKIAIENPVGYLSTAWQKPNQVVRMNWFGHSEAIKPTCLWLKNLPKLEPTDMVEPRRRGKRESEWYSLTKCPKERSKTFSGLAQAMAEQWGRR